MSQRSVNQFFDRLVILPCTKEKAASAAHVPCMGKETSEARSWDMTAPTCI